MRIIEPLPEPVSFDDVAAVLEQAIVRAPGGPPTTIGASGTYLAAALSAAGFGVVKDVAPGPQLTL